MTVTEILPGAVWLGSAPCTLAGGDFEALPTLRQVGITHVVNCTPDFPFPSASQLPVPAAGGGGEAAGAAHAAELAQHRVPVPDEDGAPIQNYFDAAADFIDAAVRGGGKVYVHCETGKSRSATIVLAYRVKHGADTLRAAWDDTKRRRPYAMPKPAFVRRLAAAFPGASEGFPQEAYDTAYMAEHFAPFGVGREAVDAALAGAGGEYADAFAALEQQVQALFS